MNKKALALTALSMLVLAGCTTSSGSGTTPPPPVVTTIDTAPPEAKIILSQEPGDLDYQAQTLKLSTNGTDVVSGVITVRNSLTTDVSLETGAHIFVSSPNGASATEISYTDDCPSVLVAGATCTLTVTFDPTNVVLHTDRQYISVQGNTNGSHRAQSMTQIEVQVATPASLESTTVGSMSVSTQNFQSQPHFAKLTVSNTSNGPVKNLAIGSISPFTAIVTNCGDIILPGDSCDLYYDGRAATQSVNTQITGDDFTGNHLSIDVNLHNYDSTQQPVNIY